MQQPGCGGGVAGRQRCLLLAPMQMHWPGGRAGRSAGHLPTLACPPLPTHRTCADFVQPESRRNEVLGWVKQGARDFSISRAAVAWGIPIPRDPKQTVYVWFDALNGYLSGARLLE